MINKLPKFTLKRTYHPVPEGTTGVLYDAKKNKIVCTLEPPNRNNAKDKPNTAINEAGCIPEGTYHVKRRDPVIYANARFKDNWEVLNVPNKLGIVFHCGNLWTDSKSCILVATFILDRNPKKDLKLAPEKRWYASQSKDAMNQFKSIMPDEFLLEIKS